MAGRCVSSSRTACPFALTSFFGERFTAIQFRDVLIDPGPLFAKRRLRRYFDETHPRIAAIVATHAHEEHAGNAPFASELAKAPIYGSEFSRTYFVRSLSETPEKVPARFPPLARLANRFRRS